MIAVGNKIKKIREYRNYTQEYMAQALNLSPSGYGKIERDEVSPTLERLSEIAKILEVDIFKVLNFDEKQILNIQHNNFSENGAIGLINSNNAIIDDVYKLLVKQLQEENQYLRTENSKLTDIIAKRN